MILVFDNINTANQVCKNLNCTPSGVCLWYPAAGSETNQIVYCASLDGRQAIDYPFNDTDSAWLTEQLQGQTGVQILNFLPDDWQWLTGP